MSSNTSLKKYGIVFALLLIVVLFLFVFDSGKTERTFKSTLVEIDTTAVTEILIYPKTTNHREVRLYKAEDEWKVNTGSKIVSVPKDKIDNLFSQLFTIKPKRLAARDEAKWAEMEVDTVGTRIKIKEGSSVTLDIIIGKFTFKQPRSMSSFVRLAEDAEVYEVDGFLDMTFNKDENAFRNANLISDDSNLWTRLAFDYPADSSFQMIKVNDKWSTGDVELDSTKVANYLRQLSRITNNNFIDDVPAGISTNDFTRRLRIDTDGGRVITVQTFEDTTNVVISSSMNTESYFDGKANKFDEKIFKGLSHFLKKEE